MQDPLQFYQEAERQFLAVEIKELKEAECREKD